MNFKKNLEYAIIIVFYLVNLNVYAQSNDQQSNNKSKDEVDTQIKSAGITNPDWWDSVELTLPASLDMNWPVQQGIWEGRGGAGQRGERGRGEQRGFQGQRGARGTGRGQIPTNVDQYLLQIIYPNASQHKQGIKLVSHLMILHKDSTEKYNRDLDTLGYLYYDLVMDYARAAYWWQKYSEAGGSADALKIARCYYELGSKEAATETLSKADNNNRDTIKLWATIGEVDKALEMVKSFTIASRGRGGRGGETNPQIERDMFAAEICRQAGRYDEALEYYKKVAAAQSSSQNMGGRGGDGRSLPNRANANIEAIELIKVLDLNKVPDGSYTGTGTGHEGNLSVKVTVKSGKIESVEVTQQNETPNRYVLAEPVTRKITAKQGFLEVDAITGATETSDAIINAVAKAIVSAMK